QVLAEAVTWLGVDELESRLFVKAPSGHQVAVCPKGQHAVAPRSRKPDALVNQAATDAEAARRGIDDQHPQFRDLLRFSNDEDAPHSLAITFRDPAALAPRIELLHELRDDGRNQRFEMLVVPVVPRIQGAVTIDDPAHVAGLRRPEDIGLARL